MLYGIGLMLVLMSAAFVGGSVIVPVVIAAVGASLMVIGKEASHGKETDSAR